MAPPAAGAPFSDEKGLLAYCMEKYRTLGPTKGGLIQQVLTQFGHNNIKALTVDQYADFYAEIEKL